MAQAYTDAERGGGSGATGRMRAAILAQLNSWHQNARWADDDRADAVIAKMNEAPERFISPNPDADYREEASRIWEKIKSDHGLRTENDAVARFRDYAAMADARAADRIDYHAHAEERARKRAEAPDVRPEHSRLYSPEPAAVESPAPRFTRPLPSWAYGLPRPVRSAVAAVWILATFDPERTENPSHV